MPTRTQLWLVCFIVGSGFVIGYSRRAVSVFAASPGLTPAAAAQQAAFPPRNRIEPVPDEAASAPKGLPSGGTAESLSLLIDRLGDESYRIREDALRSIIAQGQTAAVTLQERLAGETDPEIRHRVQYALEAVLPPEQAILVIRAAADSGVKPGDLITHVDFDRVRSKHDLDRLTRKFRGPQSVRFISSDGPHERGDFLLRSLQTTLDYRAPRGAQIAQIVRLYADGLAEQAYEHLKSLPEPTPEGEFPTQLRAIIAYTAGDSALAGVLLKDQTGLVLPADRQPSWTDPSALDFVGPFKAPFSIEATLWQQRARADQPGGPFQERDLAVQRVLVPANRFIDALIGAGSMWYHELRDKLRGPSQIEDTRHAGNMLAVSSWMLSNMELLSESIRLIEPRSQILGFTWTRVQLKAWLKFLAGDSEGALNDVYTDCRDILQRSEAAFALIRNPRVAAGVALFAYQFPQDPRLNELLNIVAQSGDTPGYAEIDTYAHWMCFSLNPRNFAVIRTHLAAIVEKMPPGDSADWARRLTILEYPADTADMASLRMARQRIETAGEDPNRKLWLAISDAMRELAGNNPSQAQALLAPFAGESDVRGLLHTAEFMVARGQAKSTPPEDKANGQSDPARELDAPLMAVPIGRSRDEWLVLTRTRRLVRFDSKRGAIDAVEPPAANWFPGPLNWPWLGRDENSGRVWVYDRRRVIEVCRSEAPLQLNIQTTDIASFNRYVAPIFDALAGELERSPITSSEDSEFLREDIRANDEFVADPNLADVGFIRVLSHDPRIVQFAVRGGPIFLIEAETGRHWSSAWFAGQLGLSSPPIFLAQAASAQPTPVVFLMSDQGLIRFDVAAAKARRIEVQQELPFPAVVPEWMPYERRDPRWVYFARTPEDGGQVFRLNVADDAIEKVDLLNMSFREEQYQLFTRGELRHRVDQAMLTASNPLPPLSEFVANAQRTVEAIKGIP